MKLIITAILVITLIKTNAQQTINLQVTDFNSVFGYSDSSIVTYKGGIAAVKESCQCSGMLVAPLLLTEGASNISIQAFVYDGHRKIDIEVSLLQVKKMNNNSAAIATAIGNGIINQIDNEEIFLKVPTSVAFSKVRNKNFLYYLGIRPIISNTPENWVNGLGIKNAIITITR
jgi:hypothetical protein